MTLLAITALVACGGDETVDTVPSGDASADVQAGDADGTDAAAPDADDDTGAIDDASGDADAGGAPDVDEDADDGEGVDTADASDASDTDDGGGGGGRVLDDWLPCSSDADCPVGFGGCVETVPLNRPAPDGTTSVAFDNGNTPSHDITITYDEADSSNTTEYPLTIGKLRRSRALLEGKDVDESMPWYCVAHPNAKHALLRSTEVTSADYNSVRALVDGQVNSFLGLDYRWTTRIANNDTNDRYVYVYRKDAVVFGMDGDIRVEIDELPEKGHAIQLAVYIDMAATRAEETKIVRINTNEAA